MDDTEIAIIGGGPGGLMTAYRLAQRLPEVGITIFEASARVGGKVRTPRFAAAPVDYEAGAAELYDYSGIGPDPLRELVDELGLRTRSLTGRAVVMDDGLLGGDEDIRRHLGESALAAIKEFARRARSLISPQEYYDADWKADDSHPLLAMQFDEILDGISDAAAIKYIRIATHSDLATEPHRTSALYGLQNYLMNEPGYMQLYTIDGGMERLTRELAKRLSAQILLNHRVLRVEKIGAEEYQVTASHAGRTMAETFDFVVAALPNNWMGAIDWAGERLGRAMAEHHKHHDYPAHYLRISLLFEKPFWRELIKDGYFMMDQFGGCCVYDESARSDGNTFGVLGWLLAGEEAMTLSNLEDGPLIERVLESLPGFLRHGREAFIEGRVHRWVGSVNGLPAGRPAKDPDSRHLPEPEEHPGLFVVGDHLFDSTINGVLDSADTVAEWLEEEITDETTEVEWKNDA